MKVSAHMSLGSWVQSIDVEYQSESVSDREEAEHFVSLIVGRDVSEINTEPDAATEDQIAIDGKEIGKTVYAYV